MAIKTVTVFGASGRQGQAQVRQLLRQGYQTRAVSRQKGIFADPAFKGVTVISADYNDATSLAKACDGADAVFYQSPQLGTRDRIMQQSLNVADAAKATGVKRRRFISDWTTTAPFSGVGRKGLAQLWKLFGSRDTNDPSYIKR